MNIQSKIASVTVFKDRALVERDANLKLKKGDCKVVFENLPLGIDSDSIQVNGSANVILQDVKLKNVYLESTSDAEKKELEIEIQRLEDLIAEIDSNVENLNGQKNFLQNMAATASESQKKSIFVLMPPEKLLANLEFYRKSLDKTDTQIRKLENEKTKLDESLQVVVSEQNNYHSGHQKQMLQVELNLFVEEDSPVELKLSYIIFNASWKPVFDLRASSTEKKMNVSYNAVVSQTTGEKWEDVRLKLSTAQAHLSANKPELSPWFINFYVEPPLELYSSGSVNYEKEDRKRSKKKAGKMLSANSEMLMDLAEMPKPIAKPKAKIETGATSVVFAIPGTNSIIDNGEEHKVGISVFEFEAEFQYNSVPKVSPFAFLTAKVKNVSDFPFLEGKTNVFLNNSFVTNSKMPLVAPNEEFKTSLGIDEGIKIEHKLLNKFHKDEGLFSKKAKLSYEYKIVVKNNKLTKENILIEDQIPISQNNDLKVEMIEPKYKEDTDLLKMSESKLLKWSIKLEPEEEYTIPIKFHVEYPREETVVGIQ